MLVPAQGPFRISASTAAGDGTAATTESFVTKNVSPVLADVFEKAGRAADGHFLLDLSNKGRLFASV